MWEGNEAKNFDVITGHTQTKPLNMLCIILGENTEKVCRHNNIMAQFFSDLLVPTCRSVSHKICTFFRAVTVLVAFFMDVSIASSCC